MAMGSYTRREKERALALYEEGHSSYEVARRLGMSKAAVLQWVEAAPDIKKRSKREAHLCKPQRKRNIEQVAAMRARGLTFGQIGYKLDVNPQTAWTRCQTDYGQQILEAAQ